MNDPGVDELRLNEWNELSMSLIFKLLSQKFFVLDLAINVKEMQTNESV